MQINRIYILAIALILCSISTLVRGQSYIVKGNVWEINSGNKPVYDVSIKFKDAEEVTSGIDGSFEVRFQEKNVGDTIYLEFIHKEKWKLINSKELETIILPQDSQLSVNAFMAFEPELSYRETNFYTISKKILFRRLKERQLSLQKRLEDGDLSLKIYQDSLAIIQRIFEAQNWRLALITENLAKLNYDQLPIPVVEALTFLESGEILEAINTLSSYTSFIEANSDTQYKLQEYLQSIALLSKLWGLYLAPQKGMFLYARLLRQNPESLDLILETATYFHYSGDYANAKIYYLKGLASPGITLKQKTDIYLTLGEILETSGSISEALFNYQLAQQAAKRQFNAHPTRVNKYTLSRSYLKLAQTYTHFSLNKPDSTLKYILNHTELSEELSEDYLFDSKLEYELTVAYELSGISYQFKGQLDSALYYFQKGQILSEALCKRYPQNGLYKLGLSSSHEMIGEIQRQQSDLPASLQNHKQSRKIRRKLKQVSPANEFIDDYLAKSETQIAKIYLKLGESDSAINCFQKALDIRKKLDEQYPGDLMLKSKLATSYYDLGLSYFFFDYSSPKTKDYFSLALDIMKKLLAKFPHNVHFQEQEALFRNALNELK